MFHLVIQVCVIFRRSVPEFCTCDYFQSTTTALLDASQLCDSFGMEYNILLLTLVSPHRQSLSMCGAGYKWDQVYSVISRQVTVCSYIYQRDREIDEAENQHR